MGSRHRDAGEQALARVLDALDGHPVEPWGPTPAARQALLAALDELSAEERVELLLLAVERMPGLRATGDVRTGSVLYAVAAQLYDRDLGLDEAQIAHLLRSARHDCGHGADTRPPLDLAVRYQRAHGFSQELGAALNDFVSNLPKSSAIQVQTIRRRAALLRVLELDVDDDHPLDRRWWIGQVREDLAATGGAERAMWEQVVLSMTVSERMVLPRTWAKVASALFAGAEAELVHSRIAAWWPSGPTVSLEGSGAQLLKHLIWSLGLTGHPDGDELVSSLASIDWKPSKRPMSVLKPAAAHLEGASSPTAALARAELLARIGEDQPVEPAPARDDADDADAAPGRPADAVRRLRSSD